MLCIERKIYLIFFIQQIQSCLIATTRKYQWYVYVCELGSQLVTDKILVLVLASSLYTLRNRISIWSDIFLRIIILTKSDGFQKLIHTDYFSTNNKLYQEPFFNFFFHCSFIFLLISAQLASRINTFQTYYVSFPHFTLFSLV